MAKPKSSVIARWQVTDILNAGRSTRSKCNHFNVNHAVNTLVLKRLDHTGQGFNWVEREGSH